MTCRFLGQVPDDRLDGVKRGLDRALAGGQPVRSRLTELGAFPGLRRARVLWVGIDDPDGALAGLSERIGRECAVTEQRAFHPHLTLARFKVPASVGPALECAGPPALDPEPFVIDRLILFRSFTERSGARYEVLDEWALEKR